MANMQSHGSEMATSPFPTGKVAVLGDLMLDIYISGKVGRISPEAPVPVLHYTAENERAGGAANVALNVAAIGGRAHLLGLVGTDPEADRLQKIVCDADVTANLIRTSLCPTTTKTRILSGKHHQFLRIDRESSFTMPKELQRELLSELEAALRDAKVLVLSDYGKGCLSEAVLREAIAMASAACVPVVVDPKRSDFSAYAGATYIKPNLTELAIAAAMPCQSNDEIGAAVEHLISQTNASILLTMSERGMALFPRDSANAPLIVPALAREVFDVSGAGDTVIAVFSTLIAGGASMETALHAATTAAGIVVSKAGTATLSARELADGLAREKVAPGNDRQRPSNLAGWDELRLRREEWRRQGLRVGFTNGCFDLLHPGHVALLQEARALCDRLIVGINSDASVRRLKGPTRPVQSETARATVIAALAVTDAVVLFDQDTPLELIHILEPDILAKGSDYDSDAIVGGDFVRARGGDVVRIPLIEGQSTTCLIQRSSPEAQKA